MNDIFDQSNVVVRDDVTKRMGGRMYYLAERHTDKGIFGFWVDKDYKDKFLTSK
jgi:hypothetical protein